MIKLLWHVYVLIIFSVLPFRADSQSPNEILDGSRYMTVEKLMVSLQNLEKTSRSLTTQLASLTSGVARLSNKVENIIIDVNELKNKQESLFKDVLTGIKKGHSDSNHAFTLVTSGIGSIDQNLREFQTEVDKYWAGERDMLQNFDSRIIAIQTAQDEQMKVYSAQTDTLRMGQKDLMASLNASFGEIKQAQLEQMQNFSITSIDTEGNSCLELRNISSTISDLKLLESQDTYAILNDLRSLKNTELKQFSAVGLAVSDARKYSSKEYSNLQVKLEELNLKQTSEFDALSSGISELARTQSSSFEKVISNLNKVDILATEQVRETRSGFSNVLSKHNENFETIVSNLGELRKAQSVQETAILDSVNQLKSSHSNQLAALTSDLHKVKITHADQLDQIGNSVYSMEVQHGNLLSAISQDVQLLVNITAPSTETSLVETTVTPTQPIPVGCVESTGSLDQLPSSCAQVQERGETRSGSYVIVPIYSHGPLPVLAYCDLETDGGGWTVFQKRGNNGNPADYFYRDWNSYVEGFGNPEKDFWLGLKYVYRLSNQEPVSLRLDLWDWEGEHRYAATRTFRLTSPDKFTIQWEGYHGTAGNSLPRSNIHFTTFDKDHDLLRRGNCAERHKGAWWYSNCHKSNLNGLYNSTAFGTGVNWFDWQGIFYSLKKTEIKLRARDFQVN